jgi:hypothetical protein
MAWKFLPFVRFVKQPPFSTFVVGRTGLSQKASTTKLLVTAFAYQQLGLSAGWPDWANFRPFSERLLWAVFNYRRSPHFGLLFSSVWGIHFVISTKNVLGYILGDFFQAHLVTLSAHFTKCLFLIVFVTTEGIGIPWYLVSNIYSYLT